MAGVRFWALLETKPDDWDMAFLFLPKLSGPERCLFVSPGAFFLSLQRSMVESQRPASVCWRPEPSSQELARGHLARESAIGFPLCSLEKSLGNDGHSV